jgi:hypothetical protein
MDKKVLADIVASDKLGVESSRQNSDLHRLKRQQQLVRTQRNKNDTKRGLEARKEANAQKAEDLKRQLAEVVEERRRLVEDAKKKPPRIYGRSHPPLQLNGYASAPNPTNVNATDMAPIIPNLTSAYAGDMVLDASQLTQVPDTTADDGTLGMFIPPADYHPEPLSQFQGTQSIDTFNSMPFYHHWG